MITLLPGPNQELIKHTGMIVLLWIVDPWPLASSQEGIENKVPETNYVMRWEF